MMLFTVPEMNLMCMFDTSSRKKLLAELSVGMSNLIPPESWERKELIELFYSSIMKINNLTDEEFSKIQFLLTNENDEGDDGGVSDNK